MKAPDTIYLPSISRSADYKNHHRDTDIGYIRADIAFGVASRYESTIEAQKAEIEDLRDLLSSTSLEAGAEIARLIKALNRYGEHSPECSRFGPGAAGDECTCGFTAALKGE